MAEEPSQLKEEMRLTIEREVSDASCEGISQKDLFAKLIKDRETEIGKVRGYFSSLTRSLGLVKWKGRWYLKTNLPRGAPAKYKKAEAEERPEERKPALPRIQEYQEVSYIQVISLHGKFTAENIHARVVLYFED